MMRFAICAAIAAAYSTAYAAPAWTLYKGAAIVQPRVAYAEADTCVAAANTQVVSKTTKFACKVSTSSTTTEKSTTVKTTIDTTVAVNVLPPPVMTAGVAVNASKLAALARGKGAAIDNLSPSIQFPEASGDGTGDFRTVCMFSHMAFDDPIVLPGQPGKSHLHTFAGNTGTNANSTAASIASTGNSTCRGGTINRSSYWQPAVIDTLDGTPIVPDSMIAYYKTGYNQVTPAEMRELPSGLRMVAGDSKGSAPVAWGPTQVVCSGPAGDVSGVDGAFPASCPVGSVLWAKVTFPQCWDGQNLDSPDHRSHMAYGNTDGAAAANGGPKLGCPTTHPVGLPAITISFLYTVKDAAAVKRWRFASDVYDKALPAGYSLHADYFEGWKPEVVKVWTADCLVAAKDCQAHMLGDGRTMNEGTP